MKLKFLLKPLKNFLFLIPAFGLAYIIFIKKSFKQSLVKHQHAVILSLLIILPQFVLYFKSGINERYLIPGITGICFLNIYVLHHLQKQQLSSFLKLSISFLLIVVLGVNTFRLVVRGYLYGEEGRVTKQYLTSVIEHTDTSSCIVIVGNPMLKIACPMADYLRAIPVGRKHVYLFPDFYTYTPFELDYGEKEVQRYFGDNRFTMIQDKSKVTTVVVYPELEEQMLAELHWFDVTKFERMEFGRATFMGSPSYGKMIYYYRK